jgi:hypothetical protein
MIRDCFKLNTNFGVLIVNYCCDTFFFSNACDPIIIIMVLALCYLLSRLIFELY